MEHALPCRTAGTPRYWSLCMTSENYGEVGPAGSAFQHRGEKHERVLVVELPTTTGAPADQINLRLVGAHSDLPVAEFEGYVDGEPLVRWMDRDNMPRVGTKLFAHAAAIKAEVDLTGLLRFDFCDINDDEFVERPDGAYFLAHEVEARCASAARVAAQAGLAVLTDERIEQIWDVTETADAETLKEVRLRFARAVARDVAARAGQVAVPVEGQVAWSIDLQARLIALGNDQADDVRDVMSEAACLLASLTGGQASTSGERQEGGA